ncbi:hypothetical protein PP301_gp013 [Gordonia phage GMA2]|uniref:Uncharacterized protein n=1 Tax=Gordonia phage GMA2 TaxID=1647283 RepID=A0A0K0N7B9_9CAUD|nr:hypothetical protein PP301_gp013 [Gordonia phage GMA2]AKJ72551.1 hypothetical protein GMA2_13 [Gordonia phage GMA2]
MEKKSLPLKKKSLETIVAGGVHYVRTAAGAKKYGVPIGSPIVKDSVTGKLKPDISLGSAAKARMPSPDTGTWEGDSTYGWGFEDTASGHTAYVKPFGTGFIWEVWSPAEDLGPGAQAMTSEGVESTREQAQQRAQERMPNKISSKKSGTASTTSTAGAASAFVGDKQRTIGKVNTGAKKGDPDHTTPKKTFADGSTPAKGQKVVSADGKVGTVVETYQAYSKIEWENSKGAGRTVANSKLNLSADSPKKKKELGSKPAPATPAKSSATAKTSAPAATAPTAPKSSPWSGYSDADLLSAFKTLSSEAEKPGFDSKSTKYAELAAEISKRGLTASKLTPEKKKRGRN